MWVCGGERSSGIEGKLNKLLKICCWLFYFFSLIAECKIVIYPLTKRLLKTVVGSEGLIFATDQIPGKSFPVYGKMVQILSFFFRKSLLLVLGRLVT